MIAVTTIFGGPTAVTEQAVERCRKHTGLPVHVLTEKHAKEFCPSLVNERSYGQGLYQLRYYMFEVFPDADRILYFDADLLFVHDWDPRPIPGPAAVRDIGWMPWSRIPQDCARWRLSLADYFNSGLLLVHRGLYQALEIIRRAIDPEMLFADQTAANLVLQEVGVQYLPASLNFTLLNDQFLAHFPVTAVHLAGNQPSKEQRLHWVDRVRPGLPDFRAHGGRFFEYRRIGLDTRVLFLRDDGTIGMGADRMERMWCPMNSGGIALFGEHGLTCVADPVEPGYYRGQWIAFEKCLVQLNAIT